MRILHVVSALDGAGVPNMVMSYLEELGVQAGEVSFVVHGSTVGRQEAHVVGLGATVHHVTPRRQSLLCNLRETWTLVRSGEYDVVHSHLNFSSVFPLTVAWIAGVPIRIAHAHGSFEPKDVIQRAWHWFSRLILSAVATDYFACSETSGKWLFGSGWRSERARSYLMRNALNLERFRASAAVVPKCVPMLPQGALVLVTVGRLSPEKNHMFLLRVAQLLREAGTRFRLLLVGEGPLLDSLSEEIDDLELNEEVVLVGYRSDVAFWLSLADVFLLPSIREGLPVSLIEAQAMGIPSIASKGVTDEVDVTGTIEFVDLDAKEWADTVLSITAKGVAADNAYLPGYDIVDASKDYLLYMRERLRSLVDEESE